MRHGPVQRTQGGEAPSTMERGRAVTQVGGDVATDTSLKPGRQIDILGSSLPLLDRMT